MPLNETAEDKMNRLRSDDVAHTEFYADKYQDITPEQKREIDLDVYIKKCAKLNPGIIRDTQEKPIEADISKGDFMVPYEVTEKEAAQYDEPEWAYPNLVIKGHMSVIVAEPNGAKTTIFMNEVCPKLVLAGYEVVYVNADVGQADSKAMVKHALDNFYRLLLPDMKEGLSMNHFVEGLQRANDNGKKFPNHIFIFDTLKKMTDVINKHHAKELFKLLRSMTAKGATIIALGHTNKYKDNDGMPVYEGTGDLRSDFDELIYFIPERHPDGSMTVSTDPDKVRGKFKPITFEIDSNRNVTLSDYVDVSAKIKSEHQLDNDSPSIELITASINTGHFIESEIRKYCSEHGTGWRTIKAVLRRYTGRFWKMERAFQNNAKQYYLI